MALPLADPQFWLVTAGAAVALGFALRRVLRSARAEGEQPCDKCPKPGAPGAARFTGPKRGPRGGAAILALALLGGAAARAATVERQVAVMGTTLRVEVEAAADRALALGLAEAMVREVEATAARLTTWRDDSELAALNRAPVGAWRVLSPALFGELSRARQCAAETGGAFDPTVGALVAAWGLRSGGAIPSPAALSVARDRTGWRGIVLREGPYRFRRAFDLRLEEGGFGKGEALDHALDLLDQRGAVTEATRVRLDLGGQIAWSGERDPVTVELADPRDRARPVLALTLAGARGSIATSGDSERRFVLAGRTVGHLLDPRRGEPAPDFGSVSVVATRAARADCLSTGLFVLGPGHGAAEAAEAFLVVEGDRLVARLAPELARGARPLVADLEIEVAGKQSS